MNIEQLDRGNRILKQIKELKESKQDLVKNYSEHVNNGYDNGISISFRQRESRSVVTFKLSNEEIKETYDLLNGFIDKKIRAAQKEFDEL